MKYLNLPAQEWLGYDPEKGDIHGYTFEQMRQFGESIVKDCLSILEQVRQDTSIDDDDEKIGVSFAAYAISKSFGIEEDEYL